MSKFMQCSNTSNGTEDVKVFTEEALKYIENYIESNSMEIISVTTITAPGYYDYHLVKK